MAEESRSIETILYEAVEISDESERQAFVERACGADVKLRRTVGQLVENHFRAGRFLESPLAWRGTVETPVFRPEAPGTRIGPYTLREMIGEGGMGMVYVAEQETPIRRKVALKIIKPGMDTREVVARFEAERQALAMMEHPHIARMLDAGVTECGRPYFVMELVRGIPITQYCDEGGVSTRERLTLFVQVCQAIQHAHQKGIIHRDIKPSNVLVTLLDGAAVPKVIDFGVAKAVGQRLTDKTVYTRFSLMIGTPLYMSPEQADINSLDVDTRSDVYSLGVLLYELLTGVTPFDRDRLQAANREELQRMFRETEPPRPSTRVTTLQTTCTSTCPRCRGEPLKLIHTLRGELDWIVVKALEKDRARRYQTARGLAADVQRYLNGEPVEACPPSWGYRLCKFMRRHRAVVATLLLVAATLVLGTAVSVWQAWEAHAARRLADTRLENEIRARRETVEREARLQLELYATDVNLAWRYWQEGDADRCAGLLARQQPSAGQVDLRGFEWRYLWNCVRRETPTFAGHEAPILTADVSPDDRLVASADRSGVIKIWDLSSGRELQTLRYGTQEVCSVRFSPDGNTLATAGQDRTVRLWDTADWVEVGRLQGHELTICEIAWSPDGESLASAARDHSVRIWDVDERREAHVLSGHTDVVRCVAWSPDGKRVASAGADRLVRLWDAERGQVAEELGGHHAGLLAIAFSPDGRWLASAGYNTSLIVYDCRTRREWARISDPGNVWSLAFAPDSRVLAVGGSQGRLSLWGLNGQEGTLLPLRSAIYSQDALRSVVFSQGGQAVLTASEDDRRIRLDPLRQLLGREIHSFADRCLDVAYQRGLAATADGEGALLIRSLHDGQVRTRMTAHTAAVLDAVFSPRADLLASCGNDGAANLHDVATGQVRHRLRVSEPPIRRLAFSPDGVWLAGGSELGTVSLWRTGNGEAVRTLRLPLEPAVTQVAFSNDNRWLAAGNHGKVVLCEVSTGRVLAVLTSSRTGVYGLAFSPDNTILAVGGDDHISLWNLAAQQESEILVGEHGQVGQAVFSPDGRTLATWGSDRTVRLWHVATGRELFMLLRSSRPLAWLRFASAHTLVVCTSPDEEAASQALVFDAQP